MASISSVEPATIYLHQSTATQDALTENLGQVPFDQVNLLKENDTNTNKALQDIINFTTAVSQLTTNTYITTRGKYEFDIGLE